MQLEKEMSKLIKELQDKKNSEPFKVEVKIDPQAVAKAIGDIFLTNR